jgi:hypothetical protein
VEAFQPAIGGRSGRSWLVPARSATPRQAGASARAPRAPGLADPAERDAAEAEEREPQAEQRERTRRPAARPKA